jgi:AraC-like DNA-binding protein
MRAATLTGYIEVARLVGLDPFKMLREAGIPPDFIADEEQRHAAGAIVSLIENSATVSGCESFGLLMADCRSFAQLGPLSLLLERLPTPRDVVEALGQYRRHFNDIMDVVLEEGQPCLIEVQILPEYATTQIVDLTISRLHRNLSGASGGRWTPLALHLIHEKPADVSQFRRCFPCEHVFGSSFNGFSCTAASLAMANPLANETMARHASRLLDLVQLGPEGAPIGDQVRRAIALLMPSGKASLEYVAANLGVTPRVLQRDLEQESLSFGILLNEVRRELAQQYLANSRHTITTISDLTGYNTSSSFSRWFAGEFGLAPQSWRATQLAIASRAESDESVH